MSRFYIFRYYMTFLSVFNDFFLNFYSFSQNVIFLSLSKTDHCLYGYMRSFKFSTLYQLFIMSHQLDTWILRTDQFFFRNYFLRFEFIDFLFQCAHKLNELYHFKSEIIEIVYETLTLIFEGIIRWIKH